jgi:ABC-type multidrug transport system fused ATPase/permease subunit
MRGRTTFMITHRLSTTLQHYDVLLHLAHGRLVDVTSAELAVAEAALVRAEHGRPLG